MWRRRLTPALLAAWARRIRSMACVIASAGDRRRGDQPRGGDVRFDGLPAVCGAYDLRERRSRLCGGDARLGHPVMGETCVQYFFLTVDEHLGAAGLSRERSMCVRRRFAARMTTAVLWQAVRDGTLQIGQHGPLRLLVSMAGMDPGRSGTSARAARTGSAMRSRIRRIGGRARNWAGAISPRFPTACRAWRTA